MLFMRVEVDSLGEALEANEAEVGLLTAMNQLMSLKFAGRGESLLTKLA